jgi:hypothetical protein
MYQQPIENIMLLTMARADLRFLPELREKPRHAAAHLPKRRSGANIAPGEVRRIGDAVA